jgi:two-component system, OmpR family, alkaline phosphatase synthesis response regulator PhoP
MATMMAELVNSSTAEFCAPRVDRILVIEHDQDLQRIIGRALVSEACEVDFVTNAIIGMALVRRQTHSALIVDFHSCGDQGPDLCRQLMEAAPRIPFVVVSANPSSVDKVLFLEMGADDYMAIPFNPRELVARLNAVQKRTFQFTPESFYMFGTVKVDFVKMEVVRDHVQIPLTVKEFRVLEFMIKNACRPISRDELLKKVWGYECYPCTRTVDNHILRLRQKLENDPADPAHLVTIHGLGYKFMR